MLERIQLLVLLTKDDEAYLVVAIDRHIDRFVTAGVVSGWAAPKPPAFPDELGFADQIIISDSVLLIEPTSVTPDEVNLAPEMHAFTRVVMDTTYLFASARIKDAPPSLDHLGFGLATDKFGSSARHDYLTIVDPYNTEAQVRVAELTGTVLYPTPGMRRLLEELYRFTPDDVQEALDRPSVFFESLEDDEAELRTIGELVPTLSDPTPELHRYHGEMVSVEGLALGAMVRTEDVPQLKNLPIHLTFKTIGVADPTGAMPILGISSEDVSGVLFGLYRFDLSVYSFPDQKAFAFLIGKQPVRVDPVTKVDTAEFGDRVQTEVTEYLVTHMETIRLTPDLTLEDSDLLVPTTGGPLILTRDASLGNRDYLAKVAFDGFLIDGGILGLPVDLLTRHGDAVIVVTADKLEYEKGLPPPTYGRSDGVSTNYLRR